MPWRCHGNASAMPCQRHGNVTNCA
jgi:hypothetical protein